MRSWVSEIIFIPDFAPGILHQNYTFIPPDDFIQTLHEVYLQNQPHQPKDRARVKTGTGGLEFTLMDVRESSCPIFLRHPVTGTVTKHEHPYPALPSIRLRSADPAFIAVRASRQLSQLYIASGLLRKFAMTNAYFIRNSPHAWFKTSGRPPAPKPPIIRLPLPCTNCAASVTGPANSALPPSRKRLRDTAPLDPCPPRKRARATPCIPLRRNPPRAAKIKAREAMATPARRRRAP
ncbi:hypothetical protein CYLTODRAFT_146597 [Cylindrobasidium torrendii FP15055 ss-10]|uniref:Uncharacterized protein n=1 Tax=Cylindrobasidium torrendii FP15055 ss-10 TaxID=1314674 RepID=A0A0D7B0Z5_9AGAR|nr:hypothetical protein CYLTODRAFT_146597 [Cylindrobasidium torrendii FP15055 ss-10]